SAAGQRVGGLRRVVPDALVSGNRIGCVSEPRRRGRARRKVYRGTARLDRRMPPCDGKADRPRAWPYRLSAHPMNRVTIRFFATLRERAHTSELIREFSDGTTVAVIWARMMREFPAMEGHRDSFRLAGYQEYVAPLYRP